MEFMGLCFTNAKICFPKLVVSFILDKLTYILECTNYKVVPKIQISINIRLTIILSPLPPTNMTLDITRKYTSLTSTLNL